MSQERNPMLSGAIWKQILILFFPILLGALFQQFYNTVDAFVVGRYVGKVALAAVGGPTSTVIALLVGLFTGLSTGATVVIAQFYGSGDEEKTSRTIHSSMALSLAVGAVMSVGGALAARPALTAMGTPQDVMPHAVTYLQIYFAGILFSVVYNMGSGILRAKGDSRRPFYLLAGGTAINLAADMIFIVLWGWGVAGVAWATTLSQAFCAAGVWILLARERGCFRLEFRRLGFDWLLLQNMLHIGVPSALQSSMYTVANIVIQAGINGFGVDTVAAWAAFGKFDALYWLIMAALGMAHCTFAAQNFGARQYDRVRKSTWVCAAMGTVISLAASAGFWYWKEPLFRFFIDDPNVVSVGAVMVNNMVPLYVTYVIVEAIGGTVRGSGDAVVLTVIMAVCICGYRLLWMWFAVPRWHEIAVVVWSYPISWILTSVLFLIYYFFSGWMERSMVRAGHRSV